MIGDKYRIEINTAGGGLSVSQPVNSTLEWSYEKEQGQIFYRKKLSTPLVFRNDPGNNVTDFTKLYSLERNRITRCDKIDVIIYKKCQGGSYQQFYNGYIAPIDGDWDVDKCSVDIPVRPQDQYACLFQNWQNDVNILNLILDRVDSRSMIGTVEYRECNRTTLAFKGVPAFVGNDNCVDQAEMNAGHWTLVYWQINVGSSVSTKWAREVYNGSQPGPDWFSVGGKWVRPVVVVENQNARIDNADTYLRQWDIVQYTITNGMKFGDVLEGMVKAYFSCSYKIVSNFFGINPDGTQPSNRAYSKARDHARNLYIYDKTDVKRAKDKDQSATGTAKHGNMPFKKMLDNLKVLFNVYFIIEPDTNILRIEHVSYFNSKRMLDLTNANYLENIKGRWKYTYDKINLPIRENFKYMEPNSYIFNGLAIQYAETCSNEDKNTNEVTYTADSFSMDVDDIVTGGAVGEILGSKNAYSDEGWVLIERAESGYIISGNAFGKVARNGNLSWNNLQDYYHRYDRPQVNGIMNGEPTKFESYKRTRKQAAIQIHLCCTDFDKFDPSHLVKTQLGWGEIGNAKYSEPREVLTLELIHD